MTSGANIHRSKIPMLIAGAVATLLGIAVSWQTLGWSRPAVYPGDFRELIRRVGNIEDLAKSNRQFTLQLEWFRLQRQINEIEAVIDGMPDQTGPRARAHRTIKQELLHRQRAIDRELGASFAPKLRDAFE